MKLKNFLVLITVLLSITLFLLNKADEATGQQQAPASSEVKQEARYAPFEEPKIKALADCILLLQPKQTPFVASFIAMHIVRECTAKSLDPDLILAQIWVESTIIAHAASNKDAIGLMQVRYPTWKLEPELHDNGVDKRSKLYWIDANIKCGTDIFARYFNESGKDIAKTLYRYYSGDPKLSKRPWEIEYINKIMYYYYKIKEHQLSGTPLEKEEDTPPASPAEAPKGPAKKG